MLNSLLLVALVVLVLWIIIMGIYLITSRKQLSIESSIENLESELDKRSADQ